MWGSFWSSSMRSVPVILGYICLIVGADVVWGPSEVSVPYGSSLSVTCGYNGGYDGYVKYWCRGEYWKSCDIIVRSGDISPSSRYSLRDYTSSNSFTVTRTGMMPEDSGTYHCGIERSFSDYMHAVRVTVQPGVCRNTSLWGAMVDFPEGFEETRENQEVEVSCKEAYEARSFQLRCVKESGVFHFHPPPDPAPCTRRCARSVIWGQNVSVYPEREYYDQEEEVTVTCAAGYHPDHPKIQCVRLNGTSVWNVTEVSCLSDQTEVQNHTRKFWRDMTASCCWGLVPPMGLKLMTIVVILIVKLSGKRRSSSVEDRRAEKKMNKTSHRTTTNVYHKGREEVTPKKGPRVTCQKAELGGVLIYENTEVDPKEIYENTEVDPMEIYKNTEVDPMEIYESTEVDPMEIYKNTEVDPMEIYKNTEVDPMEIYEITEGVL